MNILLIGNEVDDIAMDIWRTNTNYTVLNNSPYVWGKQFLKFIEDRPVIVSTTAHQFIEKDINSVIDYLIKYEFIPILIADNKQAIENNMYTAISSEIPSAVLYTKNKDKKDYKELLKITHDYVRGKGIIKNGDNIIRTSGEGEGVTSET